MPDDLLDAKAAVDWAVAQLPVLEERIVKWREDEPYSIAIDADSEPGKKVYRLTKTKPIPSLIVAETGVVIHSIRSSLDILACTLAARHGHPGSTSTYFPIWRTEADFLNPQSKVLEKIERLSQIDQAVIKSLRPYPGGNDLLYAFHQMDLTRKHRRLLSASVRPRGVGYFRVGDQPPPMFTGNRSFEEGTVLLRTDAAFPDGKVSFFPHISLNEAGIVNDVDLTAPLREFAGLANSIIDIFGYP
jgi:hypothetical protein